MRDNTQQLGPAKPDADAAPNPDLAETALAPPNTSVHPKPPDAVAQAWVGKTLDKYMITAVLGQGGMGVVLKAHDPLIDRYVAVKVLLGRLASDPSALARFLAEAKAAGKINHPNVISIFEICQDKETYYLVLEYVPGGNLAEQVDGKEPLSVLDATKAMIDACKGVGAAHTAGLIHRDLKPANFMRAADGSIKIADFGLAKVSTNPGPQITQAGTVLGTPFYMSPEQCEAKTIDLRSDIYSLGATYYSLLTGKYPFQNTDTVPQLMYMHCHGPIPDPRASNPGVPEACSRIIARAMAKSPADRYQSSAEMLADLQALVATLSGHTFIPLPSESGVVSAIHLPQSQPVQVNRPLPLILAGVAILALLALSLLIWRPWQGSPATALANAEPIKVGVLHSLTGTMASSETPVVDAVLFAIEEINQAGGVLGRRVEAVIADGRSDDATFAREAERLINEDKVCTVFGCWTSASRKTARPVFEEHDHLLIYPVQFEGLENSPCIAYLGAAPNQQIIPAVDWALGELKRKKFFLTGSDYVFPRAANVIIKEHLRRAGAEVVGEMYVPLGSQHVDAMVDAIKAAKPDMILNTINGDTNIAFFRELRSAGIKPQDTPALSFSIGEQGLSSLNPSDLAGDYLAWTYFESIASPENAEFVKRFRGKYPHRRVTDPMETAYIGVKLWAKAVNDSQSIEPKKIRRALANQRLKGPGGEVRIDPDTLYASRTPRIAQIQPDGHLKIVWTAVEPIPPDPYPSFRSAEAWHAYLHDLYTGWGNNWAAPGKEEAAGKGKR